MTSTEQIEKTIREYITAELSWDSGAELRNDTQLIDGGVIDSIGLFRLVSFLEEQFEIRVAEDELLAENFETPGRIAEYVKERMGARP